MKMGSVPTHHKQSKKDDAAAPNVCPATVILLPLSHKFEKQVRPMCIRHKYTLTHTHTGKRKSHPNDLWASIMRRPENTEEM